MRGGELNPGENSCPSRNSMAGVAKALQGQRGTTLNLHCPRDGMHCLLASPRTLNPAINFTIHKV